MYVLKTWEHEYRKAQSQLFVDFYKLNPLWVTVLKNCYAADQLKEAAISVEIMSLIRDNISARMNMTGLKEEYFDKEGAFPDRGQIRGILEHSRFTGNDKLPENEVRCGDVFLTNEGLYYINIRPDCDCIHGRHDSNNTIDTVELYLLVNGKGSWDSFVC